MCRDWREGAHVQSAMADYAVRAATLDDLEELTDIYNHYVVNTAITFDLRTFAAPERRAWFDDHRSSGPHRLLVATDARNRCLVREQQPLATQAGVRHDRRDQRLLPPGGSWARLRHGAV